jgi:hypothetical protein
MKSEMEAKRKEHQVQAKEKRRNILLHVARERLQYKSGDMKLANFCCILR